MKKMIYFEWKKIWLGKLTQLAIIGCAMFFIFCVFSNTAQTNAIRDDGTTVSGMDAIRVMKERNIPIELTQAETERIMNEYLDYTKNPDTGSDNAAYFYLSEDLYRMWYQPNKTLLGMIDGIYSNPDESEMSLKQVFEQNLGRDIQEARIARDQDKINRLLENGSLTKTQAEYWKALTSQKKPIYYGYCEGWKQVFFAGNWAVIIMMIVGIGIAPVFSGEYQSKCDSLLLCMKFGKDRLVLSKIIAAWLYATFVYWILTGGYTIAYLCLYGTAGGQFPVELLVTPLSTGYQLTMQRAVMFQQLLGYVYTLGFGGFVLLLSSLLKNTYSVIVITLPLVLILSLLSPDQGGYVWSHALSLLPSQIVNFTYDSYTAYDIAGRVFSWLSAGLLVNGIAAIILTVGSYFLFRSHQVNR